MLGLKELLENESLSAFSSEGIASPSEPSIADEDLLFSSLSRSSHFPMASPTVSGSGMEGEGDGHSFRSTSHLPSPIRRSFGNHQFNCTTMETPPPSSNSSAGFDAFLSAFEKDAVTDEKTEKHYSIQQELLLAEKIAEMKESEAKKLLSKVLVDNLGLRQELTKKEKRIVAYKGQMLAILDWKVREETEGIYDKTESKRPSSVPTTPASRTGKSKNRSRIALSETRFQSINEEDSNSSSGSSADSEETLQNLHGVRVVEEVYGIRRSLSFIQEFASSIEVDQELLKDRIKGGAYLTNQLVIGGLTGWMSAIFFKKFGKIALSAAGGGMLLLVYSARKGYVNVNYDSIYQELAKLCEDHEGLDINDEDGEGASELSNSINDDDSALLKRNEREIGKSKSKSSQSSDSWGIEKVKMARRWLSSHTYSVGGFALTFIYHMI